MAIVKILKNQTNPALDIELKNPGVTIFVGTDYTIEPEEYNLWTTVDVMDEITPYINSGDIVVNDGSRDLNSLEGIRYIEKVETLDVQKDNVDVVKSPTKLNIKGDVTVSDSGDGQVTIIW